MTAKYLLVIAVKEPVAGRVKTRLIPDLTPQEAADLYVCMITDRFNEVGKIAEVDIAIAFTPVNAFEYFAGLAPQDAYLFAQRGSGLGERVRNMFDHAFAKGYLKVVVIDSDSPDLTAETILAAFEILSHDRDVVFGPCRDGGYYLVGLTERHPDLFEDIPWSSGRELAVSLERAEKMSLKTSMLKSGNDLDTFEDLAEFYHKYSALSGKEMERPARETFVFLAGLEKIKQLQLTSK